MKPGRRSMGLLTLLSLVMVLPFPLFEVAWAESDEVLVAAVPERFPPYYQTDSEGRPSGLAIETLSHIADLAGIQVRYLVKPDWESTMMALRTGEADLIPNLGITPERAVHFDFTSPLETFGLGLFVRSVNTEVHSVDDLDGRVVAVVRDNAAVRWLDSYPQAEMRLFEHQEQALFALLAADVDGFIYPITVTWKMAAAIGVDGQIRQAGLPLLEIKRAIAVRKGNPRLLERLDKAVRDYILSEHFGEAYSRWHAEPTLFWTLERMIRYGSVLLAILFLLVSLGVWRWRHSSIRRLEHELRLRSEELAACRHAAQGNQREQQQ